MAGVGRINAVGLLYNCFIYSRMKEITYIFSGSQASLMKVELFRIWENLLRVRSG